ncbi:hypothetical protein KVG29_02470 [Caldicoprobacter algeriensis]|uniref:glycosyl hydrolase n=1 Tax=Caldicoprobacter algeriensis TaxID=699281 RepID=UPI00207AC231|nr:glycosyl hydrolase [Caldicoprobacter algeriensis]MCM8900086.1 hypothetical protein [Caldicoprobacter algeriensis]
MFKYDVFKNCYDEYRSAPFWAWNDKLEREELIHQIHEMHKQGIGGFFMHPRGGLVDKYLGDSFMEAVKICVEEAKKLNMKAWLYDEDRFPSGFGGGMVVKNNPEYAARAIQMVKLSCVNLEKDENVVKVYLYRGEHDIQDVTEMDEMEVRKAGGDVLLFKIIKLPKQPQFDNQPYTDLCNKEAVDAFIRITHEAYKKAVVEYFGGVIPGIFTDEPNFNPREQGRIISLPWTPGLPDEFKRQKGYDIMDCLPSLFLNIGNFRKVRFDFWDVLSGMFVKAFTKNIYDWCEKNGIKFTGHFWEHVFPNPLYTGSVMPNYEFMQIPGIDMLFNTKEERDQFGNVFIVKEVSSVANQLGKERVLSETYGASGWELNFADQKRVADWQFALGINLICQHLVLYSLKGFRKRDFPLSFMYHQPWWNYYKILGDYIGRLSYIMSQGEFVGDVLVLHPASSTWAEFNADGKNDLLEEIGNSVKSLVKTLCEIQCSFDLGDDVIIERHGKVEGDRFIVGKMAYRTVIVPSMTVMRISNYKLLKEFAENGGNVIATGITPSYLDGQESEELKKFFESDLVIKVNPDRSSLREILNKLGNIVVCIDEISGKGVHDIYCHVRKYGTMKAVFLCNINKEETYNVRFKLDEPYYIEEWDPVTGDKIILTPYVYNEQVYVDLEFEPVASHLLILDTNKKVQPLMSKRLDIKKNVRSLKLFDWKGKRTDYNALTLNKCSISLDDGNTWEPENNVLIIDDALKDRLGLERTHIFSRQPWMYTNEEKNRRYSLKVKYVFYVGEKLKGDVYAAVESPEVFNVYVNGKAVRCTGKTYKDRVFVMYDIKEAIVPGRNEVILNTDQYGQLTGLESIYIVGDFKLHKSTQGFILVNEDEYISPGDWTLQGYPYYSGSVKYSAEFEMNIDSDCSQVELELGDFWGVVASVTVNGCQVAILGWKPYKVDITKYINNGKNSIIVEVINSLQNLLGPHHYLPVEGVVTPGSFYCKEDVKFEKSGFNGEAVIKVFK